MKKILVFILFISLAGNCFPQKLPDIPKSELSDSTIRKNVEDAIKNERQINLSPSYFFPQNEEERVLTEKDLDRVVTVRKVTLAIDTVNNTGRYIPDNDNIFLFKNRLTTGLPHDMRFYYATRIDNAGQYEVVQNIRRHNPIVAIFAEQLVGKKLECAYAIELFPDTRWWENIKMSFYNTDTFYYKEEGKIGYFVDEGMIAFDTMEELLTHKYGSVENYIQVYKIRLKWAAQEIKRLQEKLKKGGDTHFLLRVRASILP